MSVSYTHLTAKACAPVGAVLTISAAGSETSNSCVITNEDGWLKKGVINNTNKKPNKVNMPKFNLNWLYMIIAMMLLGLYPVSYTHLDVYKRQAKHR